MRIGRSFWAAPVLWVALGCTGEDEGDASFCERFCERVRDCNPGVATNNCPPSCDLQVATGPANPEYLDAIGPCAAAASCDAINSGEYFTDCRDEGLAQVQPTPALIDGCSEISRRDFECGYTPDVNMCVDSFKIYKLAVVEGMVECARTASCDELIACYQMVFE